MKNTIGRVELLGSILQRSVRDLEATVLYIRLDEECHSIVVETLTDDRDSDYDFYLKLFNGDGIAGREDLETIALMEDVKVDLFNKLDGQSESQNMYSSIKLESQTEVLTIMPSTRFYFSKLVHRELKGGEQGKS